MRAISEFDIKFVIYSPKKENFLYWGLKQSIKEPPKF